MFAYNNTLHSSIGVDPFFLMFGRNARSPCDIDLGGEAQRYRTVGGYIKQHQNRLKTARAMAAKQAKAATAARQVKQATKVFETLPGLGQYVLVRKQAFKGRHKIKQPFPGKPVYIVKNKSGEKVLHRTQLKLSPWLPSEATDSVQEVISDESGSGNSTSIAAAGYVLRQPGNAGGVSQEEISSAGFSHDDVNNDLPSSGSRDAAQRSSDNSSGDRYPERVNRGIPRKRYQDFYLG